MQQITRNYKQKNIHLCLPDAEQVKAAYHENKKRDASIAFPHWSKLWPAALAMAAFIDEHPHYIQDKQVVELAAGLGLPSMVAATYAKHVHCSDYLPEAVETIKQSAQLNDLANITCEKIDWNHLPVTLKADVLLLSDINYEPGAFEQLYKVITTFIHDGTTIILTTPQRLMARPFIERVLHWCIFQEETTIETSGSQTFITTLILQPPAPQLHPES